MSVAPQGFGSPSGIAPSQPQPQCHQLHQPQSPGGTQGFTSPTPSYASNTVKTFS